ncbi:MAG TPA: hypothetical protein QGH10_07560, partial [Armatimonadota bacterium]|nr:hypothetical protein [Armatimonadota bacterium]
TVEDPDGDRHVPQTAVYDSAAATVRLSGLDPEVTEAVTVTVDGVTDGAGNEVSPGANEATSRPPPVESEDDEEADPEDEASPDSSEEDSDDDPNEDEGDDGARAAVYRPATPTVVMTGFSLPRITPAAVVAERETDDPGDTVSQEPDEAPPGPIPPEDEDEPEADRDAEGVTPAPESTPEETTPAESEDEPEADPVTESPAPLPEAIPEADAAEEEVTPTPEPAAPQPPGPPANRPGEGVTGGARGVVGPTPYPAFAPPMPAASAAGPMSEASAPPPLATPAPNPNAAGRAPTPEPAAAESDAAAGDPTDRPPRVTQVKATRATVSVTFSQDMDPVEVEALENYTVESPPGTTRLATTTAYDPDQKTVLLSGLSFDPGDPVRVTVSDMSNRGGTEIDPRHNSATFSEVQTWKFLVGFGVPALLFALVGVVWFSWRDL